MSIIQTLPNGVLEGENITEARRSVADLDGYWQDNEAARAQGDTLLYKTQTWSIVPDGLEGAILWGNTTLMPGVVGDEYFMTRGHWHLKRDRCEICITVSGTGVLLLMDDDRNSTKQEMTPGSTHYIDGRLAHRTVNTGGEPLVFLCAWPADCGHEYDLILKDGFSERMLKR